ncbi:FAD-binding oxidoreductase [Uliginosibacterium gangwonense]|uniref:FAD-binding oxidoreductase n=1 Tax=Uliginosibacterium gangwonense TaxID=392736 RepID=UPI000365F80E|nr:FAD-binding oxidoreductase [Uliginosibacterium gangwonense]
MSLQQALRQIVGDAHVLSGEEIAPLLVDARRRYTGRAQALVRPGSTEEVGAVVRAAREARVPIVVQGGNTGLMGAATPDKSGRAILLHLSRLNRIRAIDAYNDTITVEAGCVLQQVQEAARDAQRLFPLSLGAEGSCTIGGNLGTNAGGTQVLRYGNARDLTLGLEVVTAEGEIWHGLRGLRKDNTGYDLRDLYIGSEGTLGIITAATLKLFPLPTAQCTAFVSFPALDHALQFLGLARKGFGAALTGFEIIAADVLRFVARTTPQYPLPVDPSLAPAGGWYALIETSNEQSQEIASEIFTGVLAEAFEHGLIEDALVAASGSQRLALWGLREHGISEAQNIEGRNIKHDISLPLSRLTAFVDTSLARLQQHFPGCRPLIFGHLGDGNLHFNVSAPLGVAAVDFLAEESRVHDIVHDTTHEFGGSISAEHGIGIAKRDLLPRYKSALELQLMGRIKHALDPLNLLNPGKVLNIEPSQCEQVAKARTA